MIQREEMFHFVANIYTNTILTAKEDLKQTIANSKFPIYISPCTDKTVAEPGSELSAEHRDRCNEITDALIKKFDTDGNGVIDG